MVAASVQDLGCRVMGPTSMVFNFHAWSLTGASLRTGVSSLMVSGSAPQLPMRIIWKALNIPVPKPSPDQLNQNSEVVP